MYLINNIQSTDINTFFLRQWASKEIKFILYTTTINVYTQRIIYVFIVVAAVVRDATPVRTHAFICVCLIVLYTNPGVIIGTRTIHSNITRAKSMKQYMSCW
jgi:hypothetical protein